jgi:hypothetical protein
MTDTCLANLLATDMLESKYSLTEIRHKDVHAGIPLSKIKNPKLETRNSFSPMKLYSASTKFRRGHPCLGKVVVT